MPTLTRVVVADDMMMMLLLYNMAIGRPNG